MNVTQKRRLEQGLCVVCGVNKLKTKWHCEECAVKHKEKTACRRHVLKEKGLCTRCGKNTLKTKHFCEECACIEIRNQTQKYKSDINFWASGIARSQRGAGKVGITKERVLSVWERQQGRCAILNVPLTFAENASLDHIVPTSNGGTDELENLRIIHKNINTAKHNLPDFEFAAMLRLLYPWACEQKQIERANNDKDNLKATG